MEPKICKIELTELEMPELIAFLDTYSYYSLKDCNIDIRPLVQKIKLQVYPQLFANVPGHFLESVQKK